MNDLLPLFKNIAILPLVTTFFITFISVPAVIEIAKYFGLMDDPARRFHPAHTDSRILPRAGGLAIFMGIVAAAAMFIPFEKGMAGIILGGGLLVGVGLIDDYKDVPPYIRLIVNTIAALLAVGGGAGIPFITNPFGGGTIHLDTIRWTFHFLGPHSVLPLADLFAVIWIVWAANIVGWSGGVDGQLPGFVTISAFVIGLLSFSQISIDNFPVWTATTLAFIVSGAYLGFVPWNFFPQKILPGYSAKSLAGFLLATLAILNAAKFGTALLVLGIPAVDAIYVFATRVLSGKNTTLAGRNHLHHRLLDLGWSKSKIALFYWSVSAILGLIALTVTAQFKFFAFLSVAVVLAGFILWFNLYTIYSRRRAQGNG